MKTYFEQILGRIFSRGTAVEYAGGINFAAPLTATRNDATNKIDVSLVGSEIDVSEALEPALGDPLPVAGVFPAPLPASLSTGATAYRADLGPYAEDSDELANAGTLVLVCTLPANKRIKLTVQADGTAADETAYEIAARVIVHTDADSVTAVSVYTVDTAIDGDAEAAWADELTIAAAAGTGLNVEITLTNDSGVTLGVALCAQRESRSHPAAP